MSDGRSCACNRKMNELESATIEKQKNWVCSNQDMKELEFGKTKPCCKENENVWQRKNI